MPRGAPQTRGLYIALQKGIRGNGGVAQYMQEWQAKDNAQKNALVNAIRHVHDEDRAAQAQTNTAAHAQTNYWAVQNTQFNALAPDVDAFYNAVDDAITEYARLQQLCIRLNQAWVGLFQLEQGQPGHSNQSVQHSTNRAARATANAGIAARCVQQLSGARNHPPMPLDQNNIRRMPMALFRGVRRDLVQARAPARGIDQDIINDNVGLIHPGGGFWFMQDDSRRSQSTGTIWLKTDGNDAIIDRLYRKDVYFGEAGWIDPKQWEGDMRDPDGKTPNELACHESLLAVTRRYVVGMRESVHRGLIDNDLLTFKVYLEFCRYKDLMDLVIEHSQPQHNIRFPEPFVWYVAEALATSGLAMEKGFAMMDGIQHDDWKEIVHRDLKPENVFLDMEDEYCYPDYPKPRLGDFGHAFKTWANDLLNPRWYNDGAGTPGYLAPEHTKWINAMNWAPIDEWRFGSKTNIYGVGLILWSLLALESPPQPVWLGDGRNDTTLNLPRPVANPRPMNMYSRPLRNLVDSCLAFRPQDRPTFAEILDIIQQETDEMPGGANRSLGFRSGRTVTAVAAANAVLTPRDDYSLGFAV